MLFFVVLLSFHITFLNGTQCISSHCLKINDCVACSNVSKTVKTLWNNYMEIQMTNYKVLGSIDNFKYYESLYKIGMLCRNNCQYCGLLFRTGYSAHLPFYSFDCMHETCHLDDTQHMCCRNNSCNVPSNQLSKYLKSKIKQKFPVIPEIEAQHRKKIMMKHQKKVFTFLFVNFIIFISIAIVVIFVYVRKRPFNLYNRLEVYLKYLKIRKQRINEAEQDEMIDLQYDISCSGSGPGIPMITPKTTSHMINLIKTIGEGRFGCVWLGKWNEDDVAVKILSSRDIRSWMHEKFMYQQNYLRHANILTFITADSRDNGIATELWLVTEFHERGSLYDVLKSETVTLEQAIKMSRSITNGLAYLHMDINGVEKKSAIAHRDLKSRNILVKSSGECCIGDLGMALRLYSGIDKYYEGDNTNLGTENDAICSLPELITSLFASAKLSNDQDSNELSDKESDDRKTKFACSIVGTKRYMPPEILDGSLNDILLTPLQQGSGAKDKNINNNVDIDVKNLSCFYWENCIEAFKRADIYSYSLILWEIGSRIDASHLSIVPSPYQLPYENLVGSDPGVESMYQIVCKDQIRPLIDIDTKSSSLSNNNSDQYSNDLSALQEFCQSIRECWFAKPTARLSIMKLKRNMTNILALMNTKINSNTSNNCDNNTGVNSSTEPVISNQTTILNSDSYARETSSTVTSSSESDVYDIAPNIVIS